MPTPVLAATVALGYTWAPLPKPGSSFLAGAHCQPQVTTRSSSDNRLPTNTSHVVALVATHPHDCPNE